MPSEAAGALTPLLVSKIGTREPTNGFGGDSADEEEDECGQPASARVASVVLPSSGAQRIPGCAGGLQRCHMDRRNKQKQRIH